MSEFIDVKNIEKVYERKIALSSLSLSVKKGELIALIGPSGAGKTTLLNLLAATLTPDQGEILIDGQSLAEMNDQKKRAKKIGIIRQQFDLIGELPVIHNVLAGKLSEWGIMKSLLSMLIPQDKDDAIRALTRVGLREKLYERTSALSGGEQQRVALARLLVQSPEIVLADEPVASLDPARAEDILALLVKIASEENQTLIASLHSVDYAKKYFDRLIALQDGQIFFDLPASSVTDAQMASLYKLKEHE
ncbi:ATP-binding cassette domain-containing protein [Bacillus sp. ISL-35]|uniref:phosphonate ABC transporter ATP-binding protein n=1 Tax=Bacillus sp. ISL-35 TaxID=2819122 RepID=UPI001BEA521C|nr:ATP-binding cassette domain-containing protein [Bacillus sp. ISL-35]MBT2680878.1 ATP-binding cassette domain-containing protein [Bacillus sp. ISL-35]MBT2705194.1 ATP-binding cassette domain-containing protein [Chryseobacterium sp. ISL-80]